MGLLDDSGAGLAELARQAEQPFASVAGWAALAGLLGVVGGVLLSLAVAWVLSRRAVGGMPRWWRPHGDGEADRQRLAAIVASSSDAIIGKTLDGVITSWNQGAEQLFGYRAEEAIGCPAQMLIPPDRAHEEMRILASLADGRRVPSFDTVRLTKDGRRVSVSVSISPVRNAEGRVIGSAKIARDLSTHQRMETALRTSQAALGEVLRDSDSLLRTIHGHFIVSVADAAGTITDVNESFCRISGYRREELIGQNHRIINSGVQDRAFWVAMWRTIASGRPWRGEICNRARDGTLYWVDSVISPFTDAQGRVQKYISIRTDITAAKQAEGARLRAERLEAENRQIHEASRLKSLFLANMSHELRTPLNAVIGFADLLLDGAVDRQSPSHDEFLGHIARSGRHLLQLINDVLDLSKVEAGRLDFFPEAVALQPLVADVVSVLAPTWQRKSLRLECDVDPALGQLHLDPARLRQLLYNYLSNAIKFTPDGGRVQLRARPEGERHFRVEVQDSGPGIAAEDLPRLFVEFQQLDASYRRAHAGTGLGLALTRKLVRAQGGNVGVASTPGQGSVFHFVLPRILQAGEAAAAPLLMVERSAGLHHGLGGPLADAGFRVDVADNPRDAAQLASTRHYDAITLDLLMPTLPAQGGLAAIRAPDGPSRAAPVVALTLSNERAGAAFAVSDLFAKPIRTGEVAAAMARLKQAVNGPTQVLVVDDDPQARDLMRATLEGLGIAAWTASGGREALDLLRRQRPDALVLDLMMPGMNGFEVLDELRLSEGSECLPVYIWTSMILSDDEVQVLSRSACAILAKGDGGLRLVLDALRRWQPQPLLEAGPEPR